MAFASKPRPRFPIVPASLLECERIVLKRNSWTFSFGILASGILLIMLVLVLMIGQMPFDLDRVASSTSYELTHGNNPRIVQLRTASGVAYYSCQSSKPSVILLHGTSFTKEDWRSSGILQQFCQNWSMISLDLNVNASYEQLSHVITELNRAGRLTLPIKGLVTPSASGHAVISSLKGNVSVLASQIQSWIPVACNALLSVDVSSLTKLHGWPIFAVYGDRDTSGKRSSELLEQHSGALVKELPGRHPCYLDSPSQFVDAINDFLSTLTS